VVSRRFDLRSLAWQSEDTQSLRVRSAETVWLDDGAQALRLPLPRRAS
jgi:hypothetical protein